MVYLLPSMPKDPGKAAFDSFGLPWKSHTLNESLLLIGAKQGIRYRMFIPLNPPEGPAPVSMPPAAMPPLNINIPRGQAHQQQVQASPSQQQQQKSSSRSASPSTKEASVSTKRERPLDLSKTPGSEDGEQDENDNSFVNGNNKSSSPSKKTPPPPTPPLPGMMMPKAMVEQMAAQQQREIEAHLNFLKVKHLEFLKNQQQEQQTKSESRCEECNINFSKHQNYVAHKKYYCSGGGAKPKQMPSASLLPVVPEEEGGEQQGQALPAPPPPQPPTATARKRKGSSSVTSPTTAGNGKGEKASSPAAMGNCNKNNGPGGVSPLPVSAALGILGLAAQHPDAAAAIMTKEHMAMVLKQQQELMLKSEALQALTGKVFVEGAPPPPSILLQAAQQQQQQQTSPKGLGNQSKVSSSPSPGASQANENLPHFSCEGCGIKFKSVTNLQAHQARYCAGLRKNEEMNAFEALLKRSQQQQPPPLSLPQQPSPLAMSAAEMMSFLNAKSLEQQAKAAAAAAAAVAAASAAGGGNDISPAGKDKKSPSPSAGVAQQPGGEDFCCILCGYKDQSVERLKDHINMHFIGQVKKGGSGATAAPQARPASKSPAATTASPEKDGCSASPPLKKRIKLEFDTAASESEEATRKGPSSPNKKGDNKSPSAVAGKTSSPPTTVSSPSSLRCEACDIGFSHLSNFLAHKKYYCQGANAAAATMAEEAVKIEVEEAASEKEPSNGEKA